MYVITGGGSGIGRALARNLALLGKKVVIIGRFENKLLETAKSSNHISYIAADISTAAGRNIIANNLFQDDEIEGLIHNAGVITPITPINDITESDWNHTLAINLNAPLFLTQVLRSKMPIKRVLNIGSGAAYFPVRGWAAYCVSKAALSMLTRCFQHEINDTLFASVMPGIIDTDMQALIRLSKNMDKDKLDFFLKLHKNGHLIKPETVAIFLSWILLSSTDKQFSAVEWDIYDTSHHIYWLVPPHEVYPLES